MSDIFISYARDDRQKAQLLATALEQQGWSVWWDLNIRIGGKFDQVIKKELDAAKCVVVLWSSKSVISEWVKDEAAEAAGRGVLVPAWIEDVEIPFGFGFRRIQSAWLVDWQGALSHPEFTRLLKDISALIQDTPAKIRPLQQAGSKSWPRIIRLVAVVLVLALGTTLVILFRKYASEPGAEQSDSIPKITPMAEAGNQSEPVVSSKLYQQMTESERIAFVDNRVRQISHMIANREYILPPDSRLYIKKCVDVYAGRIGSGSKAIWTEDLNSVFKRARHYIPFINFVFRQYDVAPIIGIYIPMIESEYHECLTAPSGAMGLFQFMPETARAYGVNPSDRCKLDKITPAAAIFIRDNLTKFASDRMSVGLSIIAYNRNIDDIQRYLSEVIVLSEEESEARFWALVNDDPDFDMSQVNRIALFGETSGRYIHVFFAAAIVGEYPQSFGLDMNPLSTYDKMMN